MKRPQITHHTGKGADYTILPNQAALNKLVAGKRTINNYAKAAPSIVKNGPDIRGIKK